MQIATLIGMAQRASGILGVGQVALPQDLSDAQALLMLMLMQWRQKRWIVFRLDNVMFPVPMGIPTYTVGPADAPGFVTPPAPPDVVTNGNYRPANVQSCYLRQAVGSGPNSFPIDFPMQVLQSRQQFDQLALKSLTSWPSLIYYDPTVPYGTLYIWPIPMQPLFSLYIGFQQAIDLGSEEAQTIDFDTLLPAETQLAIMYNLALQLVTNYKLPRDPNLEAAARSTLNTLRQTNFALQPLRMPSALRGRGRMTNPMGGFYPETAAGIPTTVLS